VSIRKPARLRLSHWIRPIEQLSLESGDPPRQSLSKSYAQEPIASGASERRPYAYAWQRDQEGIEPRPPLVYVRLREVEAVFEDNYGGKFLPDNDTGRENLFIIAQHIREFGGDIVQHIVAFAAMWAFWMPEAEARALANEVIAEPRKWKADSLAKELGVTKKQRDRLGLTTIGAINCNARQRKRMRRKQRAAADAARRLAAGAQPHSKSTERMKPWEAEDISRATYYRHRKAASETNETDSRPAGVYRVLGSKQFHEVKTKPNCPESAERRDRSDGTPRRQRRASRTDDHAKEESAGRMLRLAAKPSPSHLAAKTASTSRTSGHRHGHTRRALSRRGHQRSAYTADVCDVFGRDTKSILDHRFSGC
jgi:hypothetical protein